MTTSMTRRLGGALVALALGVMLPASASAADFTVTNTADSGEGSLRQAIEAANTNGEGDTITFDPALAGGTIDLSSGQLTIADDTASRDVTIDGDLEGDGTPDITVDAQGRSRVFGTEIGAEVTLRGLVITGGNSSGSTGSDGGGISNAGTLTVANSIIRDNSADDRGAASSLASAGSPSPTAPSAATPRGTTAAASSMTARSPSPTAPSAATARPTAAASKTSACWRAAPSPATPSPAMAAAPTTPARSPSPTAPSAATAPRSTAAASLTERRS